MKLFFDEDMGTSVPKALRQAQAPCEDILFPRPGGPLRPGATDLDWLSYAGEHGYLAISANKHILDSDVERQALLDARAAVVFLASGQERVFTVFRLIVRRWDWLVELDRAESRPFAYLLTARGRVRQVVP